MVHESPGYDWRDQTPEELFGVADSQRNSNGFAKFLSCLAQCWPSSPANNAYSNQELDGSLLSESDRSLIGVDQLKHLGSGPVYSGELLGAGDEVPEDETYHPFEGYAQYTEEAEPDYLKLTAHEEGMLRGGYPKDKEKPRHGVWVDEDGSIKQQWPPTPHGRERGMSFNEIQESPSGALRVAPPQELKSARQAHTFGGTTSTISLSSGESDAEMHEVMCTHTLGLP